MFATFFAIEINNQNYIKKKLKKIVQLACSNRFLSKFKLQPLILGQGRSCLSQVLTFFPHSYFLTLSESI